MPTVQALRLPGIRSGATTLQLPNLGFAGFAVPKLRAAPAAPVIPALKTTAPTRHVVSAARHAVTKRVPIVSDAVTNVPATAAPKQQQDQFANAPVVEDEVGIPTTLAGQAQTTTPAPTSTPAPAASSSVTYSFFALSDDNTSSSPPSDITTSDVTPPTTTDTTSTVTTPPPSDPTVPVAPTTPTTTDTPQPSAPPVTGAADDSGSTPTVPTVTAGDGSDSSPATTDPSDPSVSGTTSTSSGAAPPTTSTDPGATTPSTSTDGSSDTTPQTTDSTPPDPAADPGSGPSPPAAWTVTLDPGATNVTIAVDGTNLDITVDGVVTSRPLSDIASLAITGGTGLSVDLSGGAIPVAVSYAAASTGSIAVGHGAGSTYTYDGHSGLQVAGGGIDALSVQNISSLSAGGTNDTLIGPAADTTWTISGANTGTVDSLSFTGVENLLGAPNNKDTFVLKQHGSLSGGLDGGAGGYDTLVLDGSWHSVVSDPVDHSSGTLSLDGNVISYAGLEPITNTGTLSDIVVNLPDGLANNASLTVNSGQLDLAGDNFETTLFAAPTGSITINLGDSGDTLSIGDLHTVYTGSITVNGGAGSDTLQAPDLNGTWDITGIDAGTYLPQGGGKITFSAIENLGGAPTQADTFIFHSGGAVTGSVDAGAGTLTVGVAGFVQVSGNYSFAQQTYNGDNALTVSGTSGTGLVGIGAFGNPLGLQGTLSSFGLAVVTDGTSAWDLFQGTIANPAFVGFGGSLTAGLSNLTVQVDTGAGGTYLNTHAAPIVLGSETLDFTSNVVSASTTFTVQISHFVYFAGTFTVGLGVNTTIDANTGLDALTVNLAAPGLTAILPSVSACGSTLAITSDDSTICNLPVDVLELAATNVSVFVGYSPALTPTGPNGTLQRSDIPSGAVGLFATGVDVGIALMGAFTTPNLALDAFGLKFYSLRATAADIALLGIPGLTLDASNIDVQVNGGAGWPGVGSETVSADFESTGGFTINTGGTPVTLEASGDLIKASADQILLSIGDFIYVDGGFSFSQGPSQTVDVNTGLNLTSVLETATFGTLPISATNPGGGVLGVNADGSEIWNVPVDTIELGLGNVNVFVGYAKGLALDPATHTLDKTALDAASAVGLYLAGGSLGLALMTADFPIAVLTEAPLLYGSGMKFTALKSDAGSVGLHGIPDITLTATNLEVDLNEGSAGSLWPGMPVADFQSSGGLAVPDDTSGDSVTLDFGGPIIGASADNVLLQIGSFVYVSGSFALSAGQEQWVDVATGISGALAAAEFVGVTTSDTDPGGHTLAVTSDGSMIWNLPVNTINIGIGHASVFVGYSTGLTPTGPNGTLTLADVSNANGIGLLMSDVNIGLVLMQEASILGEAPLAVILDRANLVFYGLTASATTAAIVGIPEVTATASGIQIRVNQGQAGSAWLGTAADAIPIVNFQASFGPSGYQVPLSTTGLDTVAIPYTDAEIGASADQVLFQISQFVYLSGSFSFDEGPTLLVAVETGLTHDQAVAGGLFTGISTATSAPTDGSLAITPDGSELWNVPVSSITIGIANGNIFAGYLNGNMPLDSNGNISETGLESQGSVGLFMSNVAVGLAMLRAPPLSNVLTATSVAAAAVSAAEMNFFALKADAGNVALVGIPDLTLSSTNIEVRVNQGAAAGAWVGDLFGAAPVINFQDSFPSTNGLQIPTDTTGAHPPVTLDYTDVDVGASADQVLLAISHFVYVSGGFSFDKGPGALVDVNTGLNALTGPVALGGLPTASSAPTDGSIARTSDYKTIWNFPVGTIQIGLHNVYVFAGYTSTPIDTTAGGFTHADLVNDGAIGVEIQNVNLGMVIMDESTFNIPLTAGTLITANLRFFALQATADSLGLIGVPEIQLNASGVTVSVNQGTFSGLWPALGTTGNPPVVDFVQSFGSGGYQVPTDTSGDSVALTFTAPLIGGSVQHFTIQISQFVYLTGSLSFAKQGQLAAPLTSGLVDSSTLTDLGLNTSTPGLSLTQANVNVMTIGATNVEAFVGVGGPYWNATNPDGIPDRDPTTGQIVSSEINHKAVGLVIDNLTFGLFLGTPTLPGDPIRYVALKASASDIAFVGVPGLTATAQNINVEINMSSPTLEGLPVLPVINFSGLPGGSYQVPTGALNGDGTPNTVTLDYSTPLVAASSSWIQLNLFGVLDVQGSIAFALGPQQTVKLSNGSTATLSTMTVGATNVSGFVGYNGPYITDPAGDTNSSAHGLSLDNASLGIFLGFDTASLQVYLGAHLDIPAIHLVGVPSAVTLAGTAEIDLDLGIGLLNGGTAINFATSFPVTSTHPTQGFSIPTGDPLHPVVLDFTGFTVNVNVAGTLALLSTFSLAGVFSLQADSSSLKIFGAGAMTIGPDIGSSNPLVSITALGVFILTGSGIAADVDVNAQLGIPDLGLNVTARVILNTTGADQTIEIPGRLLSVIQSYANNSSSDPADARLASLLNSRLVGCTDGTVTCYTVSGAAPAIFTTPNPTLTDVSILLGQTTGTLTYLSAGPYLVVVMSGSFNFLGFASATGVGAIEISAGNFQLAASLNFTIGPITFGAIGFIGINSTGVLVHIGIAFNENLLSLFDANLSGTLDINTQGSNDFFQLNLSGSVSVLSILSISGSLQVVVNNGAWSVTVPQANPLTAAFGPLTLTAYGNLQSNGHFSLHFIGGITLGDCSSYGCVSGTGFADASFDGSTFTFDVGGGLSAEIAGVSLFGITASGSVTGTLGQTVTLYINVSGTGTFLQQVWSVVGSVTSEVCSWLPWPLDDACSDVTSLIYGWVTEAINKLTNFSLPVATFSLPGTLGNVVTPPNLASLNTSNGVLTLNVGSLAANRNVSPTSTNEDYEINSIGPGTIKVTAFGTNQTFSGVSSITGNFGIGSDQLLLDPGMVLPVSVGGAGNAVVVGYGTPLSGLPGTGGATSLVIVDGGPNPLTVSGPSSATLYLTNLGGGTGTLSSTKLTGFHTAGGTGVTYSGFGALNLTLSPGNDTLNVVSTAANVATTVNAGQGTATINVSSDAPTDLGNLGGLAGSLTVNGIAGENDVLNISDAGDSTGRTGTLSSTGITGLGTAGINYSNVLQLNLTLGSGHNTFTVSSTAGQTLTSIATASGSATGTVTIGNDLTQIQGPVSVDGGGVDSLVISDSASSGSLNGSVTGTQLTGLGIGANAQINLSNLAALTITLGGSGNMFSIVSTTAGITTTVNAGVGNNTVVVEGTSGPTVVNAGTGNGNTVAVSGVGDLLTSIQGKLTVNGHGSDTLQVDGRNDTTAWSGSLTSSLISGLGLGTNGIVYSGIGVLTLVLGSGNDVFGVTSSIGGSSTLAITGGSDTIDLTSLSGTFILNGGNGNNTITIHSTNSGSTLTVNEGSGTNWVAIVAATGTVVVNEGSGTDTVEIGSKSATTPNAVDTGGNVNGIAGGVTVNGGVGNDSLYLDETGDSSSTGNDGTLTSTKITGLGLGAGITYAAQELVSISLGSGGTEFAIQSTSTQTTLNTGSGNDTVDISSDAKANLGTLGGLLGALTVSGQGGTDTLNISDAGDTVAGTGRLTSNKLTGFGTAGITYSTFEIVNLQLGQAADTLNVVSTYLNAVTTIRAGPGSDTINVSSDAPTDHGTLSGIAGHLVVDGQTGAGDILNVSDFGDTVGQTGALTSTGITGLGTAGIDYSNVELLNITLGSGNDTFNVASTALGTTTTLVTGAGNDVVNVSSDAPTDNGTLGGIAGHLVVDEQTGTGDILNVSDAGDTVGQTGTLTSTDITGLGTAGIHYTNVEQLNIALGSGNDAFTITSTGATTAVATGAGNDTVVVGAPSGLLSGIANPLSIDGGFAGSDFLVVTDANDTAGQTGTLTSNFISGLSTADGIGYTNFETLEIDLGKGGDTFTVLSTITGTTTVNGGPGNDTFDVETIAGPTFVNGGDGNDSITVNGDTTNPSTTNGIGALLTLDGGNGSDTYLINTFGNGDSTIAVLDSGSTSGDTLTINGTAAADVFLFRAGLVASLTGFTGGAYTHAELIEYTSAIAGGLTVNGLAGDDTFAFDDNSAPTTVNGGDGNDTFQVGQIFGAPEHFLTSVGLTGTTRGDVSNGISWATTLNGDAGDDTFSIFHNLAPLTTNGGDGNDTFMVRTFVTLDDETTVDGDGGSDLIQYLQNAPVAIDGGDGTDTVIVFGTEDDDTFTITSTSVSGSGISVSMTDIEILRVDGLEGNDTFDIQSTAAGVSTFVYGGLGSDTFNVGLNGDVSHIQGSLFLSGGDDPSVPPAFPAPILLPGETTSLLPVLSNPNLDMIEANQVDTLNVDDSGVTSGQTGSLTSSMVSGLGMDAAGIVYADIEAVNVKLGSGADTFAIESTIAGTTVVDAGAGNDAVSVVSIAGPTAVEGGDGNDTITVSNALETLAGIGSLLAIDGGTGTNTLVVDDTGNTTDSLGTLTQTSLTGLDMLGTGSVQVYSLTVGPGASSFTVTLAGFGSETFAAGTTGAALQAALQQLMFPGATCGALGTSRCAPSVFVWQFGGDYLVGFEGEVGTTPPVLTAAAPGTTATVLPRTDGINYYDIANLSIGLGSGNDRFNVRGTSASTSLNTGAGDDVVYVSDSANLGLLPSAAAGETGDLAALQSQTLYGTLTTDDLTFHGTLEEIQGALTIDEGTGSNTLAISDRGDTAPRTAVFTANSIVGLAPAPITYGATGGDLAGEGFWTLQSDSGLFGHGIQVYGGSGGNDFTVTGVYASAVPPLPFGETLTSLFTGEGNDVVHVDVAAGPARALVVDGQGGNDLIDGTGSTLPLVLFGGTGNDTLVSGSANDILFGDTGRVVYLRPAGAGGYDVVLGGPEVAAYQGAPMAADGDFLSPDAIYTDGSTVGGNDTITATTGNDLVFGGPGADGITAGNGTDVVFGDDGLVLPTLVETQDPSIAGDDTIGVGDGSDLVFGGPGADGITAGNGSDTIFGDDGSVNLATGVIQTEDPGVGGVDTIGAGNGDDLVFGGAAGDGITVGDGTDVVFGDDGSVNLATGVIQTEDPGVGGVDTIGAGNGDDLVFGGAAGDGITVGNGNDTVFGDDGKVDPNAGISQTEDPGIGGDDTILAGDGNDVLFGGTGADGITTGKGANAIFGDDGIVVWTAGGSSIASLTSTDPTDGGNDAIGAGNGNDIVVGGPGMDGITVGDGNDIVLGDDGSIVASTTAPTSAWLVPQTVATTDPGVGARDVIIAGSGNDVVLGGPGNDSITAGTGSDVAFGDDGTVTWSADGATLLSVVSTNPADGADDSITTGVGTGTDGNTIIVGGPGNDTIVAGDGADIVLGDNGEIHAAAANDNQFGGLPITIGTVFSTATSIGGDDGITTGSGNDVIIGGLGADTIAAGAGDNVVVGDNGFVQYNGADGSDATLDLVETTAPADGGGNDSITAGDGANTVLGGEGADGITVGNGGNIVLGDNGVVTWYGGKLWQIASTEPTLGDSDVVMAGNGANVIVGGAGGDTITAGDGGDLVFGDSGQIDYGKGTGVILDAMSTAPTVGGNDSITTGAGNDTIVGGAANDTIHTGNGSNLALGDNGVLTYSSGILVNVSPLADNAGGADTVVGGSGADVLMGGTGNDMIDGGAGNDLIFGDNAVLDRTSSLGNFTSPLFRALTGTLIYNPTTGAANTTSAWQLDPEGSSWWGDFRITLVDIGSGVDPSTYGNDYVAGGPGNDTIFGENGNDVIQGDGSIAIQEPGTLPASCSIGLVGAAGIDSTTLVGACRDSANALQINPSIDNAVGADGRDYIEGGAGNDTIFGNLGQDDIIGGSSNLFGQATQAQRSDGSNMIFGGSGTAIALNDPGDQSANGHANDSDAIVANNGLIFDLVGPGGGYLSFNYIAGVIPRAVTLIDYTEGNPDTPLVIGGASEIHGEAGDDFIYGGPGNDVLFGDGQNDSIVGGRGNDWISGGTGDDGILGDDGRILASIEGTAEPLNGIAALTDPNDGANANLTSQGTGQSVIVNPIGTLIYTALEIPYDLGATPQNSDDIIYGGLGNDSIHGGAGDDAISGAEALALSYTNAYDQNGVQLNSTPIESDFYHPYNPGNVLGYNPTTTKFALYDANDPLRKILLNADGSLSKTGTGLNWLMNFDATAGPLDTFWNQGTNYPSLPTDGNDIIFGDTGNDWLVGGTGRDTLWGGMGDDLLNADDNLDTNGGLNDAPDTSPSYEDFAYGGGGRDVLIANTGGDRLVDWAGEYNSFLVPFSAFGMATVDRSQNPALQTLVTNLALSQGADPQLGAGALAEIGLSIDHGGPRDPQPGNSHGQRDVLRSAGTLLIGAGPDDPAAPALTGSGTTTPPVVGGGPLTPPPVIQLPAVSVPAFVNVSTVKTATFVLTGPGGYLAAWTVSDGTTTLTGTTTLGVGGSATIVVDASSLADGTLLVRVVETDPFGNTAAASARTLKDTTPPTLTASLAPAPASTYDVGATIAMTWAASDANGVTVTGAGPIDTTQLTAGAHTFTVAATDGAGNVTTVVLSLTIAPTAQGILAAVGVFASRGAISAAEQATLVAELQNVIAALPHGSSAAPRLRTFIATVQSATAAQISAAAQTLLLNWANSVLSTL